VESPAVVLQIICFFSASNWTFCWIGFEPFEGLGGHSFYREQKNILPEAQHRWVTPQYSKIGSAVTL